MPIIYSMKNYLILMLCILIPTLSFCQEMENDELSIGKKHTISSITLGEDRTIYISLPQGYDTISRDLPVLYILDAEYRFMASHGIYSYMTYWRGVPDAILVGIANISRQTRVRDYLPASYGGDANKFYAFFQEELIPHINKNYKTSNKKYIAGHSHGGVFVMYSFLKEPNLFDGYISCDPSLGGLYALGQENIKTNYGQQRLYLCSSDVAYGDLVNENVKRSHLDAFKNFKNLFSEKSVEGLNLQVDHITDDHANSYVQGFSKGLRYVLRP